MRKKNRTLHLALCLLGGFAIWTLLVSFVDVRAIGPEGSTVGLASFNEAFRDLFGVHMLLYILTDWLSLIPASFVVYFGMLGLAQWVQRKKIVFVDRSILILGGFYAVTMAMFLFFEAVPINSRPVLIDGVLEASYPSSTTLLVLCVMPTAIMQLKIRMQNRVLRNALIWILGIFTVFMVVARLISGVHWFSDIIAGVLLSGGLVTLYKALSTRVII